MKLLVPRNKKRAVEPSRGSSHRIYHNLVLILKIYQLNLRIFWRSSKNHWFLLNNDPYIHIFLILCVWMKYNGFLRGKKKSTCAVEFQHELLFLFKKKKTFYLKKMIDRQMIVIQTWVFGRHFYWKWKKGRLPLKKITVRNIANNKIWALNWKL